MPVNTHIAKQLREIHFGKNWTWSFMAEHLSGIPWNQAIARIYELNSIATLVFHMNYYLNAVADRVSGKPPVSKHELSFQHPPISCQEDWEALLNKTWSDAEDFARFIEQLPEEKLWERISDEYGTYFRNIEGVIEHNHYHLGQIVVMKKILDNKAAASKP